MCVLFNKIMEFIRSYIYFLLTFIAFYLEQTILEHEVKQRNKVYLRCNNTQTERQRTIISYYLYLLDMDTH